jgi:hypothetical protein
MPTTNPITLIYLADAVRQDRLLELEQRQLEKEARIPSEKPLLAGLTRGLASFGTALQGQPQRKPRRV